MIFLKRNTIRNSLMIAALAMVGIFTSCKKDYTCECKSNVKGSIDVVSTISGTEDDCLDECESGTMYVGDTYILCILKKKK